MKKLILFLLFSSAVLANSQFNAINVARGQQCISNLKQIGMMLVMYQDRLDKEADSISEKLKKMNVSNSLGCCPNAKGKKEYLFLGITTSTKIPVAMDRLGNHQNSVNVLYRDGRTETIRHNAKNYQELLGSFKNLSKQEKETLAAILKKFDEEK